MQHNATFKHVWTFEAYDPEGELKWAEVIRNDITHEGLNDILDRYWKGAGYTAAHYVGLTDGTPTVAAADTMSAHPGWAEITAYNETARSDLTLGAVSGQALDNSAAKAVFTITANGTVMGGAFLATDGVKGGNAGKLVAIAPFTGGDKILDANDLLNVTVTLTASNA